MNQATPLAELRAMSDEDLVKRYDEIAKLTQVGVDFYGTELARRVAERQTEEIQSMTRQMRNLTWVIVGLTVVNTVAALVVAFGWPITR